jgi:CHASE1-domain containing sensor protein
MDLIHVLPVAAIEYSLIYMLGGGGLIGAVVIFVIARMLRR